METTKQEKIDLYRLMCRIRAFEEQSFVSFNKGLTHGVLHLYIGEEAVATGVCAALRQDDYIASTHRGHGHCIAKGGETSLMMAELFGKKEGYCRGKGGSMHIADIDLGILGANGIVAAGMPIAGGAGLSIKMRGTDQVSVCFFGDGGSNAGPFHESLNLASVWQLPVIFVCENNQYAISVSQKRSNSISDVYLRKNAYNMEGCMVDGNDVLAVYQVAKTAVDRARKGKGPTLIECKTYRWRGHYEGEENRTFTYRSKEEIEEWMDRCPVKRFRDQLVEKSVAGKKEIERIEMEIEAEISNAVQFAEKCFFPEPEEALAGLYAE